MELLDLEGDELEIPEESKISKTLSDKTTRTVVIMVLMLLFSLPVLQIETYVDPVLVHDQALKQMVMIYDRPELYP